jgi:hypothetical protein
MVTSTPSENLSLQLYESQKKKFNFGTTKTLILHTRSIFFKVGHLTKIWGGGERSYLLTGIFSFYCGMVRKRWAQVPVPVFVNVP